MELAVLPTLYDEDDFLPDPGFSVASSTGDLIFTASPVTEPDVKEIILKLHRGNLL